MSDYYKLVGHKNSDQNWTTEIILERNDDDEPTKVVRVGEPTNDLTADERKQIEDLGFVIEKSSANEAKEVAESGPDQQVGGDVVGQAPVFGAGTSSVGESGERSQGRK